MNMNRLLTRVNKYQRGRGLSTKAEVRFTVFDVFVFICRRLQKRLIERVDIGTMNLFREKFWRGLDENTLE
jgi:hypothetical protein